MQKSARVGKKLQRDTRQKHIKNDILQRGEAIRGKTEKLLRQENLCCENMEPKEIMA